MFRGLPTVSVALVALFDSPYLFTVPAYQRPYAWTIKEAGQLLEDLTLAAGLDDVETASPDYFLGAILLLDPEADGDNPPDVASGPRVFEVVDGQQRLITISLLASVLRDRYDLEASNDLEAKSVADRLHAMIAVALDDRDITSRRGRVQLRDGSQDYFVTQVVARSRRPQAFDEDSNVRCGGIRVVKDYLASEIDRLSLEERHQLSSFLMDYCHVVVIVSRDIDRAHRLFTVLNDRGKPLERKDIIKAEVLRTVPAAASSAALAIWHGAQSDLGEEFESFLGHLRLIHGLQRLPIILGIRTLVREYGSERFLSHQLGPHAAAFNAVRNFPDLADAAKHPALSASLIALNRLGKSDWVPAAILAMLHFKSAPAHAAQLMIQIERFAYVMRLLGYGAGKRQRRFAGIVEALRKGDPDAPMGAAWEITREEQRTISFHLKDLHRRNSAISKLVLMRIEDELAGTPMVIDPSELTVEHVLPLRPSATSDWKRVFPDAEQRAAYQANLGNLALVTLRQNDRAKNKDFPDKLACYLDVDPAVSQLKSNADILSAEGWRSDEILARETRLLVVIARIWQLDILPPSPGGSNGVRMFS